MKSRDQRLGTYRVLLLALSTALLVVGFATDSTSVAGALLLAVFATLCTICVEMELDRRDLLRRIREFENDAG